MTEQQTTLEESFKNYEAIQARHLEAMQSSLPPDLVQMTKERTRAFQILKNHLKTTMTATGDESGAGDIRELNRYKNWIDSIMQLDEKISDEIKKYKETLKASMHRIKQGKTAMNGYLGGTTTLSPSPSVLSMNR